MISFDEAWREYEDETRRIEGRLGQAEVTHPYMEDEGTTFSRLGARDRRSGGDCCGPAPPGRAHRPGQDPGRRLRRLRPGRQLRRTSASSGTWPCTRARRSPAPTSSRGTSGSALKTPPRQTASPHTDHDYDKLTALLLERGVSLDIIVKWE